jgi:GTP cyclohydrolase I
MNRQRRGKALKDVQSGPATRRLGIDKVGVKDIRYPVVVLDRKNKTQHTIASVNMYVDLPHQFKGTHMSRFIEILNEYRGEVTVRNFPQILMNMKEVFNASTAHLEVEFPYFMEKSAPVSRSKGLMEYRCRYTGVIGARRDFVLEVNVPVLTVCPCSKEISIKGAHNQRGVVSVALRSSGFVWIEDIVRTVEMSASSPVYSLLKRVDEKYVTERSYDNPMFVEDVVREVATNLKKIKRITWFRVEAENMESIHNHSAYALIEQGVKPEGA